MRSFAKSSSILFAAVFLATTSLFAAVDAKFHNAPDSAKNMKNPYAGDDAAAQAGKPLYAKNCLACHGKLGKGTGNIPSLVDGKLESVPPGEIFWFVTHGDKDNGMPSWAQLPASQRWKIVTYVTSVLPAVNDHTASAAPPELKCGLGSACIDHREYASAHA